MRAVALSTALVALALPAHAASGAFFSLGNTDFTVLIAFLVFVGILLYFKVPTMLAGLLDKRAATIAAELELAKQLREEARALLASYEQKSRDVQEQANRIVEAARADAITAAEAAKLDLQRAIDRKLALAEEQITAAESSVIREVREKAIAVAIAAAADVLGKQMTDENGSALVDSAIAEVGARLH